MVGIRSPVSLVVGSCTSHPGVLGSIPKLEEPGKTGAPCDVMKYLVPHGSQVINTHYRTAHLVERKYFKGHSRNPATSLPRQGHRGHCSSIDGVLAYINVPPSNLGFQIKKDVCVFRLLSTKLQPPGGTIVTAPSGLHSRVCGQSLRPSLAPNHFW